MRVPSGLTSFALLGLILGGCVTTQSASDGPAARIDAVQAGDQNLTCEELRAEAARMDGYIREGDRVEAERQKNQAGDTAASTAAGSAVPFGGLIHLMAVHQPRNAEWTNARERAGQALKRKEHLTTIANQKNYPVGSTRS